MATLTSNTVTWQERTAAYRSAALKRIPADWRLPEKYTPLLATRFPTVTQSLLSIPAECGLLSSHELNITESYSAVSLAVSLAAGKLKAVDVTIAFCKRAAIAQQLTNCLTETMFEQAAARAAYLDDYLARQGKPVGPLHGVPISLKDCLQVTGVPATVGYVSFLDHEPAGNNSALVDILLELGAVLYVKTNLPQTLMTGDSDNNIFLRALNPHRPTLTAGGSSGGEGALIAFRGSILGIGTDIGGSIRIPALCCATYGFKPSSHRIPSSGQKQCGALGSPGFPAVAGPLAGSFEDMEFLMKHVIDAKPWNYDAVALAIPWRTSSLLASKSKLRIGLLVEDEKWPCWPPIRRALATAAGTLKTAGHEVIQLKDAPSVNEGLQFALASWNLDNTQQAAKFIESGGEPYVTSVQHVIDKSKPKEGGWKLEEVFDLNVKKTDYFDRWNKVFIEQKLDCILAPGAQTTATPHDTYGSPPYTAVWNTLEYPAVIIPYLKADKTLDKDELATPDTNHPYAIEEIEGAPCHVQLVARRYHDEELVQAANIVDSCLKQ